MDRTVTTNKLICYLAHLLLLLALFTSAAAHSTERITYYHNDNLGSPVAATDTQGNVVWRESYQPDGTRTQHQGDSQNKLWFTGKQEEATFGVSYFGARWYDPEMGRFLAMDPVGVSPKNHNSFNRYAYANNNPYRFVDPDGKSPWDPANTQIGDGAFGLGGFGGGRSIGERPIKEGRTYLGPAQYHGLKPEYVENPAHLPAANGRAENPNKDVLPGDAEVVYKQAVPDVNNVWKQGDYKDQPRTWWSIGKDGDIYRYSHGNDGTAHYSGTFKSDNPIVPKYVKDRLYGNMGGGGGTKIRAERSPLLD